MLQESTIIEQAKKYCFGKKERLTRPRLEVLKIIAASMKPIGAYEILEKLGDVLDLPNPPTVYRAIDFWQHNGFIHRIDSLKAYIICSAEHRHKGTRFLICDDCGYVFESTNLELPEILRKDADIESFTATNWNIEIHGLCKKCQ